MANPLFNQLQPNNQMNDLRQRVMQLKNSIANPREEVQRLLNSGQMSQQQFNNLMMMAQNIFPNLNL